MTWLLVGAFATAAFFVGRTWQQAKNERRIDFLLNELDASACLLGEQVYVIKQQTRTIDQQEEVITSLRQHIESVQAAWQSDRDRLAMRGL